MPRMGLLEKTTRTGGKLRELKKGLAARNGSNTPSPHKDPGWPRPDHVYLISGA